MRLGNDLGWSMYLAMSWTWCIGMFLPILLLRDFGWWGYLAFALPNVIGAAAMGWFINRDRSLRFIQAHGAAVKTFSSVTIAFQVFFAFWLASGGPLGPLDKIEPSAIRGLAVLALIVAATGKPAILPPLILLIVSLNTFGFCSADGDLNWTVTPHAASDAIPLALVCALGFLLCPYLDGTFHAAAQHAHSPRRAFTFGFVLFFPSMILGTLLYTHRGLDPSVAATTAFGWLAVLHIGLQLAFTIHEHVRAGLVLEAAHPRVPLRGPAGIVAIGAVVLFNFIGDRPDFWHGLSAGELIYRLFMSFYGLVFPAYVYLCVIPRRGAPLAMPTRAAIRLWLFTCGLAGPFFYMGFIERQPWFLAPGVAIVLLARIVLPTPPSPAPSGGGAERSEAEGVLRAD